MASIKLRDYLVSLTSKSNAADADILPLLDSTDGNSIATIQKGTLTDLDNIAGWTAFSSSVEGDLFALSFASSSNVSSSLQQQIDINNLGAYTASLKQAISVSGTDVQIIGELRAQKFFVDYITSSVSLLTGSNEFGDEPTDNHTFIGKVYINGDGPIGLSQLNSFSGSQLSVNTGLSAVTGAFATELGDLQSNVTDFTNVLSGVAAVSGAIVTELSGIQNNISSFNNVFSGVSAVTGAFATELSGIQSDITTAENNINSFNNVFSGVSAVTGAFATELGQLQTQNTSQGGVNTGLSAVTGAFATELGGIQTTLTGHRGELSGLEAWTASLDSTYATDAQVADAVAGLNTQTGSQNSINSGISAITGAFSTELGGIQNNISSFNSVFGGVSAVTGAFSTELGGIQSNITSFTNVFSGVSAVTGAFATELGQLQTQNTSQGGVNTGLSAVTGAFATELGEIQTSLTQFSGIEAYTSSLKSVSLVSGSSQIVSLLDNQNVDFGTGNITGSSAQFTGSLSVGTNNLNNRIFRVYGSGDIAQFTSTNPGVGGAQIDITHESATPADGDNIGIINFGGFDTGLNATQYANIKAIVSSVSSEIGELHFGTRQDSTTYNGSNMILDGNGAVSASVFHISETAKLVSQNPLPTGVAGMLAVSASGAEEKLYFHNGTIWRELSFV